MGTIRYDATKNRFLITAPPQQLGVVMKIPMRRHMAKLGVWVAPASRLNCELMLKVMDDWTWDDGARTAAESTQVRDEAKRAWPIWYKHGGPPPLAHQKDAAALAYAHDSYFLSMEQGTMKTKIAIDVACAHRLHNRITTCLVICPLTVTRTWHDELRTHCPLPFKLVYGNSKFTGIEVKPEEIGFVVLGVESFSQGHTAEVMIEWAKYNDFMIVMDESHWIKNHASIRTQSIIALGRYAKSRLCLTGTPVTKNLIDLYSQYEFLDTNIMGIGDFYAFRNRYAIMGGFKNKNVIGYDNVEELMGFLRPYTYSITKAQCLDLPPKVYERRYVDLHPEHRKQYDLLRKKKLQPFIFKNALEKALRCRQLVGGFLPGEEKDSIEWRVPPAKNAKLQALLQEIETFPGQAIIFAQWRPEVALIQGVLDPKDTFVFTGDVNIDERQDMIHGFQAGDRRFFLSTIQAGGIGTTLTAAETVAYFSSSDNYATRMQSEDRAHRGGTKHTVTYFDFIANQTIDETSAAAHLEKLDLAAYVRAAIEGGSYDRLVL